MITTPPLISVVIPTRDRAALLQRALDSIWAQQMADVEVLVVDDASNDRTAELLQTTAALEGRLRWLRNDVPRGACVARNRGIDQARGRYVTGLDDDDEMVPGRLYALLGALRPSHAFTCASDWLETPCERRRVRISPRHIDLTMILARNVVGNQIFAEREKVIACGGFDERLPAGQDYDLWIRMIQRHGPARGLQIPLQIVHAQTHLPSITRSPKRRSGYWMVYLKHRSLMERSTRAIHLYNMHKASTKRLGNAYARTFFVPGNRLRLISRLLSERTSVMAKLLQQASEAYTRLMYR